MVIYPPPPQLIQSLRVIPTDLAFKQLIDELSSSGRVSVLAIIEKHNQTGLQMSNVHQCCFFFFK